VPLSSQGPLIITGGAGFIGSNLVRHVLQHTSDRVVVVDKLTYAGNLLSLEQALKDPRVSFVQADIADASSMQHVCFEYRPRAILNLAAETHVDRSIEGPGAFVHTNMVGTFVLLQAARAFVEKLPAHDRGAFRFLHVSTDEVYGTLGPDGLFSEETPYAPNSPYSARNTTSAAAMRAPTSK